MSTRPRRGATATSTRSRKAQRKTSTKTAAAKIKAPPAPLSVTLRDIENEGPCGGEYFEFLQRLKSVPLEDGDYYSRFSEQFRVPRKPAYGSDDPIPLSVILKLANKGRYWVLWLVSHIPALSSKWDEAEEAIGEFTDAVDRVKLLAFIGVPAADADLLKMAPVPDVLAPYYTTTIHTASTGKR